MPGVFRCDLTNACALLPNNIAHAAIGRIGRPAFPAPSEYRGRELTGEPRAKRAARSRNCGCILWSGEARSSIQHPLVVGAVERKGRHLDLELLAALADHLITSRHEARRGRKRDAAGIFIAFARGQYRLLSDHPYAADFLLPSRRIGDDPVPGAQLHRLGARIGDDDRVGPEKLTAFDRRAFRQEVRLDGDFDLAGDGAVHARLIFRDGEASYPIVPAEPIAGPGVDLSLPIWVPIVV